MPAGPKNIADHGWLAMDDLSDCIGNVATYLGRNGVQQNQGTVTGSIAANSALVINAAQGNLFIYTLTANVTGATIVGGVLGQQITVEFVQGAGGSHTVSWPVAKYAGGAAPTTSTVATYVDSVTYTYDGTNWQETARSIGVH